MFRRAFWFTTGAATGVWATTKVQRKLRRLAPESLAVRAAGRAVAAGRRARDFTLDVRAGMAEREHELNEVLGIGPAPAPAPVRVLPAPAAKARLRRAPDRPAPPGTTLETSLEKRTTDGVG